MDGLERFAINESNGICQCGAHLQTENNIFAIKAQSFPTLASSQQFEMWGHKQRGRACKLYGAFNLAVKSCVVGQLAGHAPVQARPGEA